MDHDVAREVLYTGLLGTLISFPLRYYLMKNQIDRPRQNAAILTAWGLVVGYTIFEHSRCRLQERRLSNSPDPMVY